jgi:DNA repair protein RecO (recombination protein O)
MIGKTKGIVFRKLNYGETSLIVDIFTEEYGLMSYIMGGIRKPKARSGTVLLQLMSVVDLVAYHSERTKLHRIKEAHAAYIFQNIPQDIRKNAILLFLAEFCSKVIRQTERNPELYQLTEQTVVQLDQATGQFNDHHLLFMIRLADVLGFGPEGQTDPDQQFFDLADGRFVFDRPDHAWYTTGGETIQQYLQAAREIGIGTKLSTDRKTRNEMLDTLLLYFNLHIEKMPEMHAHKVLREIL